MKNTLLRFCAYALGLGLLLQLGSRWITFMTPLPLWALASAGAALLEGSRLLYRRERESIPPRIRRWVYLLRSASILLLLFLLAQPTLVWERDRRVDQQVAVLLDVSPSMEMDDASNDSASRAEEARKLLDHEALATLGETFGLRFFTFSEDLAEYDPAAGDIPAPAPDAATTDLAAILEDVRQEIPADKLAGCLLLSDARQTSGIPLDDIAIQLGNQASPIVPVLLGKAAGIRDAAILQVKAPSSIYLGDRAVMDAELKLDGLQGKTARVSLLSGDTLIEEREVSIPEAHYRPVLRFLHVPADKGVVSCTLTIAPMKGERFDDNNTQPIQIAVSDDRTNVLLVDGHARWEFRYLRNLFYGRDKSVHLQYVLLHPDRISGQEEAPPLPASASRPFGEAEANQLPTSREEWLQFDAIILGDMEPEVLDDETWEHISYCVEKRGALLVCMAGPRHMPHDYADTPLRELLPVNLDPENQAEAIQSDEGFLFRPTTAGEKHPILQLAETAHQNLAQWAERPPLRWRYPAGRIKEGAEVLAYAETLDADSMEPANIDPGAAFKRLAEQREREHAGALLVTHRYALGKVVFFATDRTWRFRYGVGDAIHHRLWGQLLRWGTAANLRDGTRRVRLGTDALTYRPAAPVQVRARLSSEKYMPVQKAQVTAELCRGDEVLYRRQLHYLEDSNGIYTGSFDAPTEAGEYQLRLAGGDISKLLQLEEVDKVSSTLRVAGAAYSPERADFSADADSATRMANLSGGKVLLTEQFEDILTCYNERREEHRDRLERSLWDHALIPILLLALLTAEWLLRRRHGLP